MEILFDNKAAKLAWANGEFLQIKTNDVWCDLVESKVSLSIFDQPFVEFRVKPKTVKINGVECGLLISSSWENKNPNIVTLEFSSRNEAVEFQHNAMKIFNGVK